MQSATLDVLGLSRKCDCARWVGNVSIYMTGVTNGMCSVLFKLLLVFFWTEQIRRGEEMHCYMSWRGGGQHTFLRCQGGLERDVYDVVRTYIQPGGNGRRVGHMKIYQNRKRMNFPPMSFLSLTEFEKRSTVHLQQV